MSIELEAHIGIGDLKEHGDSIVSRLRGPERPKPRYIRRAATAVGMGGFTYLTLGSPPVGFYWTIRSITAYCGDAFNNPTGFFAMYIGAPPIGNTPVSDGTYPFMNQGDLACTNIDPPSTVFFSEHSINVMPQDEVIFIFSATVASPSEIGANATITELPLEPIMRPNNPRF